MKPVFIGVEVKEPFTRAIITNLHTGKRIKQVCYTDVELINTFYLYGDTSIYFITLCYVTPEEAGEIYATNTQF